MSALLRCLVCCLLSWTLHASSVVRADASADPAQEARALFEHGLAEADATHWTEAATLFQQALALRDSPVIRFNLSSALAELGRLVEASELLRALELDTRTAPPLLARVVHDRQVIQGRLAYLTIRVQTRAGDFRVLLDERALSYDQLGVGIPLDPKLHYLSLRVGERVLQDSQVELREGEQRELTLAGEIPAPALAAGPTTAPLAIGVLGLPRADQDDDSPRSKRKRRWIWGVSAALVAVAAGTIAGVLIAHKDDANTPAADAFTPGRVGVRVPQ